MEKCHDKWRKKVRFINESGFYFFLLFDSQIPAAYIRKRFNFESGLDSEKYSTSSGAATI